MIRPALTTAVVIALGYVLSLAAPAAAQYGPPPPPPPGYRPTPGYYQPPPPPPGVQRRGFTIGASLGGGSFEATCKNCNVADRFEGISGELHLGGMIRSDLAILFDGWIVGAALNDFQSLVHNVGTVALRWWPARILWLQGGLGFAQFSLDDSRCNPGECQQNSETGGAIMVGAGIEIIQATNFTLDVSLRFGAAGYSDADVNMSSLQIGVNWY